MSIRKIQVFSSIKRSYEDEIRVIISDLEGNVIAKAELAHPRTRAKAPACYVTNFFVIRKFRGKGYGHIIFNELKRIAKDEFGCARLEGEVINPRQIKIRESASPETRFFFEDYPNPKIELTSEQAQELTKGGINVLAITPLRRPLVRRPVKVRQHTRRL